MRISDWSSDVCSSDLWSFPNVAVARARIRQAEAQGDASLAALDGKVLTALKEVEQVLSLYGAEEDRNSALADASARAEAAYKLADVRYRAGAQIGRASGRERVCQFVSI